MAKLNLTDSYVTHLPKALNIDEQIRENPIEVRKFENNEPAVIDYIALILCEITERYIRIKDAEPEDFVDMHSSILRKLWSDYIVVIGWAVKSGILVSDETYISREKSYGYAFTPEFSPENTKKFYIKTKAIVKKMSTLYTENESTRKYPQLKKDIDLIEIDKEAAYQTLREIYGKTIYNKRTAAVDNIHLGKKHFTVDHVGRLHTPIVSLKRELRQHLHIDGKKFRNVDIKNSQPFFSLLLLDETKYKAFGIKEKLKRFSKYYKEDDRHYNDLVHMCQRNRQKLDTSITKYKELVLNGGLYKFIAEEFGLKDRDAGKGEMFTILFSPSNYEGSVQKFKELFPEVHDIFSQINIGYTKTGKHRKSYEQTSTLALLLQSIESEVMLEYVVPNLKVKLHDEPMYTIHDSVMLYSEFADEAKLLMKTIIEIFTGYIPMIEVEN